MEITMKDILPLNEFYQRVKNNNKLSIKTAYKFSKLFSNLDNEVAFYQNKISELIQRYGARDENGNLISTDDKNYISIKEDERQECEKELNELADIKVEMKDITFNLDELENLELSIGDLKILNPFIIEE